jgi:hypothetical protein
MAACRESPVNLADIPSRSLQSRPMPEPAATSNENYRTRPGARQSAANPRVFLRLVKLLRPYWPMIGLGLLLLLLSTPCELFPAFVWRFVTDDVVLGQHTSPTLNWWFSFGARSRGLTACSSAPSAGC